MLTILIDLIQSLVDAGIIPANRQQSAVDAITARFNAKYADTQPEKHPNK